MTCGKARDCGVVMMFAGLVAMVLIGQWNVAVAQDAPPPPPPPRHERDSDSPTDRPAVAHIPAPTTRPLLPLAAGERRLPVKFNGGHDTDHRDHGRPVILIAAALNVPADVFRQTFTHVHPTGPGSGGPTDAEARQNKAALMAGLSPYGVTDDRLNAVSNYYRYMRHNHDDLWKHRAAVAYAIVGAGNKVVRFDVTDAGAGYTSPPTVTIGGLPEVTAAATLEFGTDLPTNGSIKSLAVTAPTTEPSQ